MKTIKYLVYKPCGVVLEGTERAEGQHREPIANTQGEYNLFPIDFYPQGDTIEISKDKIDPYLAYSLIRYELLNILVRLDNDYSNAVPETFRKAKILLPTSSNLGEIEAYYKNMIDSKDLEAMKENNKPDLKSTATRIIDKK
jgi:hypothetical protein